MTIRTLAPAAAAILLVLPGLSACGPSAEDHPLAVGRGLTDGTAPLFLALSERPNAVMEALFQGSVAADDAGCLRLDSAEPATVVWPYGSSLQETDGSLRVLDENGEEIGRVGGHFRFGGGFVQSLHEGIPVTDADRAQATSRCPGSYWIVGDIL